MTYKVGQSATCTKTITESDVQLFAKLSGDFNPIHVNRAVAEKSFFGRQVAHGLLVGSLLSTVIGTKLPGEGTIFMEEGMKFLKPVFIGDTVTAKILVDEIINEDKGVIRLLSVVTNQDNETVIEGFAIVKAPGVPAE